MRANFAAAAAALVIGAGCTDMYNDNRIKPLEESRFFENRSASRPIVEGTVPYGSPAPGVVGTGKTAGTFATQIPLRVDSAFLARGRDRFETFCAPCHGRTGEGTGMIVQRGFPKPNSFHTDSVRAKPAGYYFDVITNGFGRMYSYAPSVAPADRWAIVAYIRALQLSRRVDAASLTPAERERLR